MKVVATKEEKNELEDKGFEDITPKNSKKVSKEEPEGGKQDED